MNCLLTFIKKNVDGLMYFFRYTIAIVIKFILYIRHFLYDKNILKSYQFSNVYTICIGNLNLGGTGKSPMTSYLIQVLKPHFKIAVLSRGYGRKTKGFQWVHQNGSYLEYGDEPLMYKIKHTDVNVAVCENRVKGIRKIMEAFSDTQIILLDDAFQHRRLKAHFNIVLTEYVHPFYEDDVFPAGKLRDLKSSIQRADVIVFTKTPENVDINAFEKRKQEVRKYAEKEVFFSGIEYQKFYHLLDTKATLDWIKDLDKHNVILVTGIANPTPLAKLLKKYGHYFFHLQYPDHHAFTKSDIEIILSILKEWQEKHPPVILVTTEKDAVRLKPFFINQVNLPIFVAPIDIHFFNDTLLFNQKILEHVRTNSTNRSIYS